MSTIFCIDCKHMEGPPGFEKCRRTLRLSPVDGTELMTSCMTARAWELAEGCGPAGKFFEPADRTEEKTNRARMSALAAPGLYRGMPPENPPPPPADCKECQEITNHGGFGPSHNGARSCESGSIASGGNRAHCTCDTCF